MTDYHDMTPEERFAELDRMATEFFGTKRWKTEFARRYGIQVQAVGRWMREGAEVRWVVAMRDALDAKRFHEIKKLIED